MDLKERELIQRCRDGDRRAFEILVKRYQRRVFGIAFGIVRDTEEAADVAQEAFYRAYKNIAGFKGNSSFYTWIYRITVNLAFDLAKRRARTQTVEHDEMRRGNEEQSDWRALQPDVENPDRALVSKELAERVSEAMARLSETHRAVLVLREIEGLTYEEIARVMNSSQGTVMSRLFHARKNMQKMLHGYLRNGGGDA